jgi:hypothetical protein
MAQHLDPQEAFPDEVRDLHEKQGIPWPTWYAGPLYTGNGPEAALKALEEHQAGQNALGVTPSPATDNIA